MDTSQSNSNLDLIALNNHVRNKILPGNMPVHDWYRFVLSFPPHLVKYYIEKFGLNKNSTVLDPFCGTGTTVVESKLSGIKAIGIEAHPMAYFASKVKTTWNIDSDGLVHHAELIAKKTDDILTAQSIADVPFFNDNECSFEILETLPPEKMGLLLKNSISPLPLHKALLLLRLLKPGAQLAYVVGDQASYLRVIIKTGELLAEIAESMGYEVVDLELFRTRFATATKEQIREEVLLLKWPKKNVKN